jgi:hypothetical protein
VSVIAISIGFGAGVERPGGAIAIIGARFDPGRPPRRRAGSAMVPLEKFGLVRI